MKYKKQILIASLLVLFAAIPTTLLLMQEPQETRSRAVASTTLSYTPNTTGAQPIEKNIGDTVAFDVIVTPGNNLPSLVKLEMQYDAAIFQPATDPFTVNVAAFPTTIEGPVIIDGKVLISVSIGSDATKAIQQPTKVGTLNLITKTTTNGSPSVISFGTRSQVLSLAQNDEANENVLATTSPTYVNVNQSTIPTVTIAATIQPSPTVAPTVAPTATPTPVPTIEPTTLPLPTATATLIPTVQPSQFPVATINPTQIPIPTPTFTPFAMKLSFNILMHGVGNSGDNANPLDNDLSNKQPQNPTREVTTFIYDDTNQLALTKTGIVTYDSLTGSFRGTIDVGTTLTSGDYTVRIKEITHLRRLVTGIQRLTAQQDNILPDVTMVAGDVNGDNSLNILDYNLLVGCYSDLLPAISCTDANKVKTDLNDNGGVNQFDYNLFLREITVQSGN